MAAEASSSSSTASSSTTNKKDKPERFDLDPSTPGRRVPHKKANSPYLVHQRWKEEQVRLRSKAEAEAAAAMSATKTTKGASKVAGVGGKTAQKEERRTLPFLIFKWSLVVSLLAIAAGQFIAGDVLWGYRGKYAKKETYLEHAVPSLMKTFTPEELWQFNGEGGKTPIYLSILGNVYDVTPGQWVYGPRGSYHFFAGRDASRAYVTGCFQTHLTHDLRGLSADELMAINEWKEFFDEHPKYRRIGRVDLKPIDPSTPIPAPCGNNAEQKKADEVASEQASSSSSSS